MIESEQQTTDNVKTTSSTAKDVDRRGVSLLLLLLISLLALLRSSYTISTLYFSSSSNAVASSPIVIPLVTNYSISMASASSSHHVSSESLPIYLIDTLSNIADTNIAASTWGKIASNWNRTTQYSNLLSLSSAVSSLPNQYSISNDKTKQQRRRKIILIHCGPKSGSTTLRKACIKNLQRTCPQLNLTKHGHESRGRAPAGYFGGEQLVAVMKECVDTSHFCVNQITVMDLLPSAITTTESDLDATTTAATAQDVQYIHLFPFRTYDDWVKSAIKQQYDRAGEQGCRSAEEHWADGKCQHFQMEIDIRKYGRVDLDRFQDGVVKRMNNLEERGIEEHTFVLYLHRNLEQAMGELSARYHMPLLPGTGAKLKGKRVEGNCNESLVEQYHECFSDELMEFRWDLPKNQLRPA